jgi:hypothetical protein
MIDLNTVTVMLVEEIAEKAVRCISLTPVAQNSRLDRIEVALAF